METLQANQELGNQLAQVVGAQPMSVLEDAITKVAYMQLVKSKNKQSEVSVIKKAAFLEATGIPGEAIVPFEPLIFLNQKF